VRIPKFSPKKKKCPAQEAPESALGATVRWLRALYRYVPDLRSELIEIGERWLMEIPGLKRLQLLRGVAHRLPLRLSLAPHRRHLDSLHELASSLT
jgi:hypothetical protein